MEYPLTHQFNPLLYRLKGEVTYRYGDWLFHLRPGDSLFSDAKAQHGPEINARLPARGLPVISCPRPRPGSIRSQSGQVPGEVGAPSSYCDSHSTMSGRFRAKPLYTARGSGSSRTTR